MTMTAVLPQSTGVRLGQAFVRTHFPTDVIVGVPTYGSARGVVALYYGPLSGSQTLEGADLHVEGSVSGGRLGVAVAGAGDVNGLGRPDVVAGSLKLPDEDVGDRGYGYLLLSDGL